MIHIFFLFDTIHTFLSIFLSAPAGLCRPPLFNSGARSRDQCVQCFCFGLTDQCVSSGLYKYDVSLTVIIHRSNFVAFVSIVGYLHVISKYDLFFILAKQ